MRVAPELTSMSDDEAPARGIVYCAHPLAAFACRPDNSRGRMYAQPESAYRTPWQRDRDRVIHCTAFRRLKYKTQVFVPHEGDHYRTRLTHTLEVAQIARTLARALGVNEDLTEAVALSHDLGHTPFAHGGEEALSRCMEPYGGFSHNDQSLRVLTTLERRYPKWPGLNLTWETLEGVVKHNGPVQGDLPWTLQEVQAVADLQPETHASLEAQIAGLSDDIAYNNHDVEDGLRAGLFTISDLEEITLLGEIVDHVRAEYEDISDHYLIQEAIREMIGRMVTDVLEETKSRLVLIRPESADDVRAAGQNIVGFSDGMEEKVDELRDFLFERMYRHYSQNRIWAKIEKIVAGLFEAFMDNYRLLPTEWQARVEEQGGGTEEIVRARVVADYIAGMTDRYAVSEYQKIFDLVRM